MDSHSTVDHPCSDGTSALGQFRHIRRARTITRFNFLRFKRHEAITSDPRPTRMSPRVEDPCVPLAGERLSLLALAPQQPVTIVGVTIPDDLQLGEDIVDCGRLLGSELDVDGVDILDRAFRRARSGDGHDLSG